jgi:predicted RNase H-like HicB family nuclease
MSETPSETPAPEQESPEPTTEPEQPDQDTQEESGDDDSGEKWDVEKAKRQVRKLTSENRALRERANKAPKAEDVQAKDQRISELEAANLRYDVGYELGLPKAVAKRLQGNTREEMLADAEELIEQFAPTRRPSTRKPAEALRGGTQPEQEPEETDVRKLGERMFSH